MNVRMYRNNRLDQPEELDPISLARDFIDTIHGTANPDYKTSGRLNLEFEYRWFLSGSSSCLAWDEGDWPVIWHALEEQLNLMTENEYSEFLCRLG